MIRKSAVQLIYQHISKVSAVLLVNHDCDCDKFWVRIFQRTEIFTRERKRL